MEISIIVAAAANNVIGRDGGLPWHLSEDLRRFKAVTMGKPIVMGRLTHDSIGHPLPGRQNIILSSATDYSVPGCDTAQSAQAALALVPDAEEVMIIGGGHVYREFLPLASRIYLTRVHADIEGDTYFPDIDPDVWRITAAEEFPASDERDYAFSIECLQRR